MPTFLRHQPQVELSKSVTFHDFSDLRQRLAKHEGVLEEEDEEGYEEAASSSSTQHSNVSSPASNLGPSEDKNVMSEKKKANRRLPLNNSFSSWLQLFLSKRRRNGAFVDRNSFSEARLASIRPSVSLCKRWMTTLR